MITHGFVLKPQFIVWTSSPFIRSQRVCQVLKKRPLQNRLSLDTKVHAMQDIRDQQLDCELRKQLFPSSGCDIQHSVLHTYQDIAILNVHLQLHGSPCQTPQFNTISFWILRCHFELCSTTLRQIFRHKICVTLHVSLPVHPHWPTHRGTI